jgi:hypothetical protein
VRGLRSHATPIPFETLARDGCKVARFYARLGITESEIRGGIPRKETSEVDPIECPLTAENWVVERLARERAVFLGGYANRLDANSLALGAR